MQKVGALLPESSTIRGLSIISCLKGAEARPEVGDMSEKGLITALVRMTRMIHKPLVSLFKLKSVVWH